jgi:hypothetical protein
MVCELEVIFGLDPISGLLGIARHALVFLEQLGGVSALAIVLAIAAAVIAGHAPGLLSTAAAPTVALTIIDQIEFSSSHWRNRACKSFTRR